MELEPPNVEKVASISKVDKKSKEIKRPKGKPARCPDCGAIVIDDMQPCRVCAVRRWKARQRAKREA